MTMLPHLIDLTEERPRGGNTHIVQSIHEIENLHTEKDDIIKIKAGHYGHVLDWHMEGVWIEPENPMIDEVIFSWDSDKNSYIRGKENTFHRLKFSNKGGPTLRTLGDRTTIWGCSIFDSGANLEDTEPAASIYARSSKLRLYNNVIEWGKSIGIYVGTDYENKPLFDMDIQNNTYSHISGSGIQFNPHESGFMTGKHIVSGNYFENVGHETDRAAIVVTPRESVNQLQGSLYINDNFIKQCKWGIKINKNNSCKVFVLKNRVTQCDFGLTQKENIHSVPTTWADNYSWNNKINIHKSPKTNSIWSNNLQTPPDDEWNGGKITIPDEVVSIPDESQNEEIENLQKQVNKYKSILDQINELSKVD